jgi:hypothetical protein
MEDIIPTLLTIAFLIFCLDQKIIVSLQRQGKYDPDTHQTLMSRVFFWPLKPVMKMILPAEMQPIVSDGQANWKPEGDLSKFKYDTTVCMNKQGGKTRLSYFFDENQHAWFKVEKINKVGIANEPPRFEPAAVTFDVKKLQYV